MPENTIVTEFIIKMLLLALAIERITEILVASKLLLPVRDYFRQKQLESTGYSGWWFLDGVFQCGYCMSVWVSLGLAWIWPVYFLNYYIINYLISIFVYHGLSNITHVVYELLRRGRVRYYDLSLNYKRISEGG